MNRAYVSSILWAALLVFPSASAFGQFGDIKLTKSADARKIAHFKIAGAVVEEPQDMPLLNLFDVDQPESLKSLLERMKKARSDNNVKAIVMDLERAELGLAQIEEIRAALSSFAAVDKEVFVHADMLHTPTYALATGASHISVTPTGDVFLLGLYGESPYLKDGLAKLGITADMEHCGDYKSAHEHFTRTGPSAEAQRMTDWLLDSAYDNVVKMIAKGRKLTPEQVKQLIDGGPYTAEEALAKGLIDSVQHRRDFVADLKKRFGEEVEIATGYGKDNEMDEIPQDPFGALTFFFNLLNPTPKAHSQPSVAIVYVEGMILPGEAESTPFGEQDGAFSSSIRKALDEAAEDDTVKAVVLRVDSPGGSALASEVILDATKRVIAKKPLVVSMGNVAASGGYYVACGGGTIFADEGTITGSIGVVGGKFVTTAGWEKLGINWSKNQRGKMAGLFSSAAPFSDEERARVAKLMNDVYGSFKKHVTDARGTRLSKAIDELAGGRVYTGVQALENGLVDRMGGLDDAIKHAAKAANVGEYDIRVIPEPKSLFEMFNPSGDDEYTYSRVQRADVTHSPLMEAFMPALEALDPLRARAVLRSLNCIDLIQREGVVTMMPGELVVH